MSQDQHLYVRRASAGSGKTFTLAAHYIALLMHGESYRSILAVTFTNKATAEMKERILTYLYGIARETTLPATQGFLRRVREIYAELGYRTELLTDDYCRHRAEQLFLQILSDYDGMKVSTIDAFLQTLLAGMVQMLGGAVGYQVELDTDGVISDAVDRLLTERAQEQEVRRRLTSYMQKRMSEEKHWDVRAGLKQVAKELYREELQQKAGQLVLEEGRLNEMRERVRWTDYAPVETLKSVMAQVPEQKTADKNAKERVRKSLSGEIKEGKDLFRAYTDTQYQKLTIGSPEQQMHDLAIECRRAMLRENFLTRHLDDLVLMNELRLLIRESLQAANSRLLGETAGTLAQTLKDGDADFILEKVGIRYRHIMLDEFQDTSSLQWENFRHLLEEILATTEGSTLIVGDIKQSIYRWRNGDWKIMAGLDQEWSGYYNEDIPALKCNFRSEREVVQFNLDTMSALSSKEDKDTIAPIYNEGYNGTNITDYYRSGHDGGYVSLRCFTTAAKGENRHATRREMVKLMLEAIDRLHGYGVPYHEMMILIRMNKEAAEILQVMKDLGYDYPIVSNDCFVLDSSPSVRVLIAAMRWIYLRDEVSAEYLRMARPDLEPKTLLTPACRQFSLSDLTEHLTRLYLCDEQGQCHVEDIAYLMSFKDKVRGYVATVGSDGERFLTNWEEDLKKKTIASAEVDGIRMMTVHTSKGLEAANVFIPFCDWSMEGDRSDSRLWCEVDELTTERGDRAILPIPMNSHTAEAGFAAEYAEEHRLQRIDSLNLLYVALTRAAERLYIYADATGSDSVAQSLMNLYGESHERGVEWEEKTTNPIREQSSVSEKKPTQPFRFDGAEAIPVRVFSSEEHIEFQQSQDSRKYGWNIASMSQDTDTIDQRVWGTICHDVMALLGVYDDQNTAIAAITQILNEAYQHGIIPAEDMKEAIRPLLLDVVSDPVAGQWFTGDWRVLREEAVAFRNANGEVEERRMDRVMWRDQEAIVLDYKFGHDDPSYDRQVRHYMSICRRMGAKTVKGYLWIAREKRLVEVSA